MLNNTQNQLLELIRSAISGDLCSFPSEPKPEEWNALFELSKKQTVAGICFSAIKDLKASGNGTTNLNRILYVSWLALSANIQKEYNHHCKVIGTVDDCLSHDGIPHYFMKGLSCGARYRHPEMRQCGDIDFVVSGKDYDRTMRSLSKIGKIDADLLHEHHGEAIVDGVVLEPHYKMHSFENSANDRYMDFLQSWLFDNKEHRTASIGECSSIPVMPLTLESVFLLGHMVYHVYEEGLGLRQVVDYAMFLNKSYADIDKELHEEWLQKMNMKRAHKIFVRICEKYLGVSTEICGYSYSTAELKFADELMEDIMRVGNFGRAEYEFDHSSAKGALNNYLWITRRAMRLRYLCPSEAWAWPVKKFSRFWKKKLLNRV